MLCWSWSHHPQPKLSAPQAQPRKQTGRLAARSKAVWLHFSPVIPEHRTHPRVAFTGRRWPCPLSLKPLHERERQRGRINLTNRWFSCSVLVMLLLASNRAHAAHSPHYLKTNNIHMPIKTSPIKSYETHTNTADTRAGRWKHTWWFVGVLME